MAKWGGCGLAFKEGGSAFGGRYGFVGVRESDSWAEVCGSEVRGGRQTQKELK